MEIYFFYNRPSLKLVLIETTVQNHTQKKRLECLHVQQAKNSNGGAVLLAPGTVEEEERAKTYDVMPFPCWKMQIAKLKNVAGY